MRKWGIVISVFYAVIVLGLLAPAAIPLAGGVKSVQEFLLDARHIYVEWLAWIPIVALLGGQILLLFLSVDTSHRKLKPKTHIAISCIAAGALFGLLLFAAILSVGSAISGDKFGDGYLDTDASAISLWVALWLIWGVVFYLYFRNSTTCNIATRVVAVEGERAGASDRGPLPRDCAATRRLLRSGGDQLRYSYGNCSDAALVRAERSAAVQEAAGRVCGAADEMRA